jgi:hypothetical protein
MTYWLVVWNMNFMTFHLLGLICSEGRYTTNQYTSTY